MITYTLDFVFDDLFSSFNGDAIDGDVVWIRLGVGIEKGDGEYECGVIERDEIDSSFVIFDETESDDDDDDDES